ncbi:MAG: hypothetical protein R2757_21220 [Draconibacterium sp.]|jgi:ABC-type uncharacterized transport system auxiliary subunit
MATNKVLWMILWGLSIVFFSGCGSNSQNGDVKSAPIENAVSEELHQAQCDLLANANEQLANINQKVRDLNVKIKDKGGKLTDAQNAALDDFEAKQISINKRMHEIKNIKEADWESFKASFEKDLEEINAAIDNILKEF